MSSRAAAVSIVAGLVTEFASSAEPDQERAGMVVGAFLTDRSSSLRLDSPDGRGTDIDLEGELGLEQSTSAGRIGGHFWASRKHRLDFALYDLSREGSRPIEETIRFGERIFTVDTEITTEADFLILKADYTFAALMRERGFLGITGGLYVARNQIELRERTLGGAESEQLTAPLPLAGIRGSITSPIGSRLAEPSSGSASRPPMSTEACGIAT